MSENESTETCPACRGAADGPYCLVCGDTGIRPAGDFPVLPGEAMRAIERAFRDVPYGGSAALVEVRTLADVETNLRRLSETMRILARSS